MSVMLHHRTSITMHGSQSCSLPHTTDRIRCASLVGQIKYCDANKNVGIFECSERIFRDLSCSIKGQCMHEAAQEQKRNDTETIHF